MNAKSISGQTLSHPGLLNIYFPKPKRTFIGSSTNKGAVLIGAQILWWGLGLTLAYDICEVIFHWPHWMAIVLYSALMISSSWFRNDVLVLIGLLTLPSLLGTAYFTVFPAHQGTPFIGSWGVLLNLKSYEYLGWFFMVLGSFINAMLVPSKKNRLIKVVCCLSIILGGLMMLKSAMVAAQFKEPPERVFILLQQVSYFLWIFGVSSTQAKQTKPKVKSKNPMRLAILCAGILIMLLFDIIFLNTTGIMKYIVVFLPPLSIMILSKYLSFLSDL